MLPLLELYDIAVDSSGGCRRKKKAGRKSDPSFAARLVKIEEKLGLAIIPGIEDVNFFQDDGKIIHFSSCSG